jgi:hypothetical protein
MTLESMGKESSTVYSIAWRSYRVIKGPSEPYTGDLSVVFHKTGLYTYHDVPRDIYATVLNAESIGSALYQFVQKGGCYHFTKGEQA